MFNSFYSKYKIIVILPSLCSLFLRFPFLFESYDICKFFQNLKSRNETLPYLNKKVFLFKSYFPDAKETPRP